MSTRSSSLNAYTTLGISREIDSKYDIVRAVAAKLDIIEELNDEDIEALVASLNEAKDFTGITVVAGEVANWDSANKVLTVPTVSGEDGNDGTDGKSAYELAVVNGFTGTQTEWLNSLQGTNGAPGAAGKSAYQIAVDNGFTGTETEWLNSIRGADGNDGADGVNGQTPQVEFAYNNETGELTYTVTYT